jgi:hypothetical protein
MYDRIHENFYRITESQVEWVIERCAIYAIDAANKGKPPIKPIKSKRCSDRILIDLMDFRATADGEYKWIMQVKCPFSRYI